MKEYDLYLPMADNDGKPIDASILEEVKKRVAKAFGGYTHLQQRNEGAWRVGDVTFRDEVTILRVLEGSRSDFDMKEFKCELERRLQQESILIVAREVEVL